MKLNRLEISRFRGIKNLILKDLQDINLIIGDNDSGKTTVLEAIKLFECPDDVAAVVMASRMRMINRYSLTQEYYSPYESFLHLFPFSDQRIKTLELYAQFDEQEYPFFIEGEIGRELNTQRSNNERKRNHETDVEREISVFYGRIGFNNEEFPIELAEDDRFSATGKNRIYAKIEYIAPGQHLLGTKRSVFRSKTWERETVKLLRIIDPEIEGAKLVPSEYGVGVNPVLEHRVHGEIPLYTCGDGMKKIFMLASVLPSVKGGILMIDEIETSLQAKHLISVFDWLLDACMHYDVQLFITTHSAEAISALSTSAFAHPSQLACYRLEKYNGRINAHRYSEQRLENIVNGSGLDVR